MKECDVRKICEEKDFMFVSIDDSNKKDKVVYYTIRGFLVKCRLVNFPPKLYQKRTFVDQEDYPLYFKQKLQDIHSYKYTYPNFRLNHPTDKITVFCREHGEFVCDYTNHLQGKGCQACAIKYRLGADQRSTTEDFIKKSKCVHGDKYDYSSVIYLNNTTCVKIWCPIHGKFEQSPSVHLRGGGCSKCGDLSATKKKSEQGACGYSRNSYCSIVKMSSVYLFKLLDEGRVLYKIGISSNPKSRAYRVAKDSKFKVQCVYYKEMCSEDAYDAEKLLQLNFRQYRISLTKKFHGSTECFSKVNLTEFLKIVNTF